MEEQFGVPIGNGDDILSCVCEKSNLGRLNPGDLDFGVRICLLISDSSSLTRESELCWFRFRIVALGYLFLGSRNPRSVPWIRI